MHKKCDKCADVWSYGIVLWEIFSLGKTPYGTAEIDKEDLLKLHSTGKPLPFPEFANESLYEIMQACWGHDAISRPLFPELLQNYFERNKLVETSFIKVNCSKSFILTLIIILPFLFCFSGLLQRTLKSK